jgi:hypothetical protein
MKLQLHIHAQKICCGLDNSSSLPLWAAAMVKRFVAELPSKQVSCAGSEMSTRALLKGFLTGAVS